MDMHNKSTVGILLTVTILLGGTILAPFVRKEEKAGVSGETAPVSVSTTVSKPAAYATTLAAKSTTSQEDYYDMGLDALADDDYDQALRYFKKAGSYEDAKTYVQRIELIKRAESNGLLVIPDIYAFLNEKRVCEAYSELNKGILVRDEPSASPNSYVKVPEGTRMTVWASYSGYCLVELDSGAIGWVTGSVLYDVENSSGPTVHIEISDNDSTTKIYKATERSCGIPARILSKQTRFRRGSCTLPRADHRSYPQYRAAGTIETPGLSTIEVYRYLYGIAYPKLCGGAAFYETMVDLTHSGNKVPNLVIWLDEDCNESPEDAGCHEIAILAVRNGKVVRLDSFINREDDEVSRDYYLCKLGGKWYILCCQIEFHTGSCWESYELWYYNENGKRIIAESSDKLKTSLEYSTDLTIREERAMGSKDYIILTTEQKNAFYGRLNYLVSKSAVLSAFTNDSGTSLK